MDFKVVKKADKEKQLGISEKPKVIPLVPKKRQFAVVRGKKGRKNFRKWHPDQGSAIAEAKRVSAKEGGLFFVIESKTLVVCGKPKEDEQAITLEEIE